MNDENYTNFIWKNILLEGLIIGNLKLFKYVLIYIGDVWENVKILIGKI